DQLRPALEQAGLAARARLGVARNHPMSREVVLLQDCYERIVAAAALRSRVASEAEAKPASAEPVRHS
ncbi:MAG: hypothetical protein ACOC0P_07980, partial [Planctomycetota bacterium]